MGELEIVQDDIVIFFKKKVCDFEIPATKQYAVRMVFVPKVPTKSFFFAKPLLKHL
jgi:hypothetical protein